MLKKVLKLFDTNNNESVIDNENELNLRTHSYTDAIKSEENNNTVVETSIEIKDNNLKNLDLDNNSDDIINENIKCLKDNIDLLENRKYINGVNKLHSYAYKIDQKSDKLCVWLQIFTSCFSSFAHGSNDVANAVAPLPQFIQYINTKQLRKKTDVPIWILVLGGIGIVFGYFTWGYKIINRMGKDITKITK